MTIIIDYDNDSVRIGKDSQSKMIEVLITGSMSQVTRLICEIVNVACDEKEISIELLQQDEGQLTAIEDY